jgi:DNA-binding transcriptional MerR regulator
VGKPATPDATTPTRTWAIGELAEEFGVTLRTLRFYEDRGLLRPERRGTTRVFHAGDRVRLELVLRGRRLGFSLDEVAAILGMYDAEPGEVGQLRYLLEQVALRRDELLARRRDLDATLAELDELGHRCEQDLARLTSSAPGVAP